MRETEERFNALTVRALETIDIHGAALEFAGCRRALERFALTGAPFAEVMSLLRKSYVMAAIRLERGSYSAAARRIGLHRNTVERIMDGAPEPANGAGAGVQAERRAD